MLGDLYSCDRPQSILQLATRCFITGLASEATSVTVGGTAVSPLKSTRLLRKGLSGKAAEQSCSVADTAGSIVT